MANLISDIIKKKLGMPIDISNNDKKIHKHVNEYFNNLRSNNLRSNDFSSNKFKPSIDGLKNQFINKANEITGNFIINDENKPIINTLFYYFLSNKEFYKKNHTIINKRDLNKGILLIGNTGSGKTSLLEIFRKLRWQRFRKFSSYKFVEDFEKFGETGLDFYLKGDILFDDIGIEMDAFYYGKRENIGSRILEKRYNLYKDNGLKTHITTNLDLHQLKEKYGFRLEGRLYEMFNIIYLGKNSDSVDFRIQYHK